MQAARRHQNRMEEALEDQDRMTSQQALCDPEQKARKPLRISSLKIFILVLSFACFSRSLTATHMKSSITQIERHFDISTTHVGLIDGSFEMGNLLFLAVISHFGAQLHRPRFISGGCLVMALGALLTGLTHFFMGRYEYGTLSQGFQNDTLNHAACVERAVSHMDTEGSEDRNAACARESGSYMWVYVFLGNALRGIGETPIIPLGFSYIDDFAKADESPFFIACLQTIILIGHMFGFLVGSFCAKLYVDVGSVDLESVSITPKDARWVGAWWMGFLISSGLMFMSAIPFWFLPRSPLKPEEDERRCGDKDGAVAADSSENNLKLADIAKKFVPALKRLLGTPVYCLFLCGSILRFNSIIGQITFTPKYMEQQFGLSTTRANFLVGVLNLPAVALGILLGGLVMKRYKLSMVSGAQLYFATSITAYLLTLLYFSTKCDNIPVAGLTVSYNGTQNISHSDEMLFSECNQGCSCAAGQWDPMCSDSGVTYVSPCLAGCRSSTRRGKNIVFDNCSCVHVSSPANSSRSVRPGQCPQTKECSRSFTSYMAISVLSSFIDSLGVTPGYMVIIRCIHPELKSLALGIHMLLNRTLGGIPAPVYFGALIDSTCLKWSIKKCGGRGACRIYESNKYRIIFLSLITCLSGCSYFFLIGVIFVLRRDAAKPEAQPENAAKEIELQSPSHPPKDHLNAAMEWEEGKGVEGPRPQGQSETAALAAEPEGKVA
ncbi:solute carrier organic anion transporter family member 1C1-like isoform X1 [Takifugu rubripes]|uniref:solute carrier organic anion transporter family member 1C1-like isoform X1 n=2 Tax=Takifugu rubripes TaxID=31033 RepID=UPI00114550BD|nr:solute carrier organic anion transporter family member 1C1-like isoform X1 [Takifugu rubripes]XP_029681487.1 solute carrier organic anion transporter family member 1C1-like isoform X1 [Takifugu rubripes]